MTYENPPDILSSAHPASPSEQRKSKKKPLNVIFSYDIWKYLTMLAEYEVKKPRSQVFREAILDNRGMALLEEECSYSELSTLFQRRELMMGNHYQTESKFIISSPKWHQLSIDEWFKIHVSAMSDIIGIPAGCIALAMFCRGIGGFVAPQRIMRESTDVLSQFMAIVESRRRQMESDLNG